MLQYTYMTPMSCMYKLFVLTEIGCLYILYSFHQPLYHTGVKGDEEILPGTFGESWRATRCQMQEM